MNFDTTFGGAATSPEDGLGSSSHHALFRSIVTVYVGPEKYPFYLHVGKLNKVSKYFQAALKGDFVEGEQQIVTLDDIEVETFQLFEVWLYDNFLEYPQTADDIFLLLAKAFCFGDRIDCSRFQNAALDAIHHWSTSSSPTSDAIAYAWDMTLESSTLRTLLTDVFAYHARPGTVDNALTDYPKEFLAEVVRINMGRLYDPSSKMPDYDSFGYSPKGGRINASAFYHVCKSFQDPKPPANPKESHGGGNSGYEDHEGEQCAVDGCLTYCLRPPKWARS